MAAPGSRRSRNTSTKSDIAPGFVIDLLMPLVKRLPQSAPVYCGLGFLAAIARTATEFAVVALLGAALLALVPMLAIMPKPTAEGITLASPIFDHSKIAMIDEMMRAGVPPRNPFFGEAGAPERES